MKKILKSKKLYKRLLILAILIYAGYVFMSQQNTINSYKNTQKYYADQITTQTAYTDSLQQTKSNINSKDYIEEMAREKLDMYLPNEKVYIDKGQ